MGITIHHADSLPDWTARVQAIGALIGVALTIIIFVMQSVLRHRASVRDQRKQVLAATTLASYSVAYLTDRFAAILEPPIRFALRGARTTEMILAMRELNLSSLPADIVESYAAVRSAVFAVNERITEVFRTEKSAKRKSERLRRLESAGRVFNEAIESLDRLNKLAKMKFEVSLVVKPLPESVRAYVELSVANGKADIQYED